MNDEINVLIVEDEDIWAEYLATKLEDLGYAIAGIANTFEAAVQLLAATRYDIVLVDINLNHRNSGIEIGKLIYSLYKTPFIFITASFEPQTVADAVSAHPSAYLPKPVNPTSLMVAIQNAINNHQGGHIAAHTTPADDVLFFFVKQGNKYKKINWEEVVYLKAGKNYTMLYNAPDKTVYSVRSTFPKTLAEMVPAKLRNRFIQVNRAEAVQSTYINEMRSDEIFTSFGNFSVSETFIKTVKHDLKLKA
jgi:CheY-like chemotaxis protein